MIKKRSVAKAGGASVAADKASGSYVKTRNTYKFDHWVLMLNEAKNSAKIAVDAPVAGVSKVRVTQSNGWVRLLSAVHCDDEPRVYRLRLDARETLKTSTSYPDCFLFRRVGDRFDKHTKLTLQDGVYEVAIFMPEDRPEFWIGIEWCEPAFECFIGSQVVEVLENRKFIEECLENGRKLTLPVAEGTGKHDTYRKLTNCTQRLGAAPQSSELKELLEYAVALRRVEMVDTACGILKYLIVKNNELNDTDRANLARHATTAYVCTRDREIYELLVRHAPDLVLALDLGTEALLELSTSDGDTSGAPTGLNEPRAMYSLLDDPAALLEYLRGRYRSDNKFFVQDPTRYCAMANVYAREGSRRPEYKAYLNRFLSTESLPRLEYVADNDANVLSGIRFETPVPIHRGPVVSIIMSAYNAADTVGYAIRSLLEQSYSNIEILFCDDRSDDGTLDIAREVARTDDRVRLFQSTANQGTYNIRNNMLKVAKGDYVTFNDSDDFSLPIRIEQQLESLSSGRSLICFGSWLRVRPDGKVVFFRDGRARRFCVVSAMAHRSVFERMRPFRSSLVAADTEFYELCKFHLGSDAIDVMQKPLIFGLWGDGSLTRRPGLDAGYDGYVAAPRRRYSDIAARQRLLGEQIVEDGDIRAVLEEFALFRQGGDSIEVEAEAGPTRERVSSLNDRAA